MRNLTLLTLAVFCIYPFAFAEDPVDPFGNGAPSVTSSGNTVDAEWKHSFNASKNTSTIESVNGLLIEVVGTFEEFDDQLTDSPANKIVFRRFVTTHPMEIGAFCNDLSAILDCTVRIPASIRRLQIPMCTLRNINLISALDTISLESDSQFSISIEQNGESLRSGDVIISVTREDHDPAETEVLSRIFQLPPTYGSTDPETDAKQTLDLVLSLSEAALTTIESAGGPPMKSLPKIHLHRESRIVIVAGKVKELEVVGAVIKAIGGELVEAPNLHSGPAPAGGAMGGGGGGMF